MNNAQNVLSELMKDFFLILLFSKTVLLTPDPINLHGRLELVPDKPIEAITSGASIQLDVSSMAAWNGKEDILAFRKRLSDLFPSGTIKAKLVGNGEEVTLSYQGNHQFNKDNVMLSLYTDDGIPTGVEFTKVIIESSIKLNRIKVYWKNYKH